MKKILSAVLPAALLLCGCSSAEPAAPQPSVDPAIAHEIIDSFEHQLDPFLNDGMKLPDSEKADVRWTVVSGNAVIEDNVIRKSENAAEYEPVVLSLSLNDVPQEHAFEHLCLLDEYSGYLISYFSERTDEPETMKLAYTYNGVEWFALNNDRAVLKASAGTGRLRDPALIRKKDGTFAVCATQGYDTDSIYLYDSPDMITFENERLLKVNQAPLQEQQAWAPEGFYHRTDDTYVLYWSSVSDGGMFYNTSDDLQTVSAPFPLVNTGYPVIDGTIVHQGDTWAIVLKDEQSPMEEHSQIFVGLSDESWNSFSRFSDPVSGHQSEGPMVMKDPENEGWYIFYDDYTRYQFHALYTQDFTSLYFDEVPEQYLSIPLDSPAHSFALPVTQKELDRLISAYQ